MRVLLDTSTFLWFVDGNEKLSAHAREIIADPENQLILSVASLWEIAIKISLKKLELLRPYEQLIPQQLDENDINVLPINIVHLGKIIDLPCYHRDPFDRLIIAQALVENVPIITSDAAFSRYPVSVIW